MKKRLKLKDIHLANIVIGKEQLHDKKIDKVINKLASNIGKNDILQTFFVCPACERGKYLLLTGLHYFFAYRKLNKKTIKAVVVHKLNETEIRQVNLTESRQIQEISSEDYERIKKLKWNLFATLFFIFPYIMSIFRIL